MALAFAPVSTTISAVVARRPRPVRQRRPLALGIDRRYRFTDDGLRIEEIATGRTFHRDLWATRGL